MLRTLKRQNINNLPAVSSGFFDCITIRSVSYEEICSRTAFTEDRATRASEDRSRASERAGRLVMYIQIKIVLLFLWYKGETPLLKTSLCTTEWHTGGGMFSLTRRCRRCRRW